MSDQRSDLQITVLIPTYNRADILCETLEAMCKVDREGLSVEFVVIDNNSNDHTKAVVESFSKRLPICYLFEPRPGKNCALNKALNEVLLGDIVVFTDDDVSPYESWLRNINDACVRWPSEYIFGGRIMANWPGENPDWIMKRWGSHLSLGDHDMGEKEKIIAAEQGVSGANMWIRGDIFKKGYRFDERIGPKPKNRIAGSEISFQIVLRRMGYNIIYVPTSIVRHRPEQKLYGYHAIMKRAWSYGRGTPLMRGIPNAKLYNNHTLTWYMQRILVIIYATLRLIITCVLYQGQKRIGKSIDPMYDIAYNIQAIKLAVNNRGNSII